MALIRMTDPVEATAKAMRARQPLLTGSGTQVDATRTAPRPPAEEMLRARVSCRDFRESEIGPAVLQRVLASAYAAEAGVWPMRVHGDPGFLTLLGASAVSGLAPGIYARTPDTAGPTAYSALGGAELLADLREQYADAPALMFVTGDFARIPANASGYGGLVSRAGALGYAIWQAALAEGLSASVFGRSFREVTDISRSLRPGQRHLFTVALGYSEGAISGTDHP
ncbi:hypothetical protein [Streptosporangium amethystogenes]|uniref:hypothetical protein n=1 Tax=Streptosporangium amethystogenes TaxID=2002 RepID=UPI0004C72479|nr:hypothetical protein [Streptosporangium amethystogenes]